MWIRPGEAPASRPPTSGISAKRPGAAVRPTTRHAHARHFGSTSWIPHGVHKCMSMSMSTPPTDCRSLRHTKAWIQQEFGQAELGDRRLSARLVKSATMMAAVCGDAAVAQCAPEVATTKDHYRFMDQKEDSEVTPKNILAPHRARTVERMRNETVVLCIQDGSTLNYGTHLACEDLQTIGRNQTATKTKGLPLGVLRCLYAYEDTGPLRPKAQAWLSGFHDVCEAVETLPKDTRVVVVMDREADNMALLYAQHASNRVDVLVRMRRNHTLGPGKKVTHAVSRTPLASTVQLEVKPQSARKKSEPRAGRQALLEVRFKRVTLPPKKKTDTPVALYAVQAKEVGGGDHPIERICLRRCRSEPWPMPYTIRAGGGSKSTSGC